MAGMGNRQQARAVASSNMASSNGGKLEVDNTATAVVPNDATAFNMICGHSVLSGRHTKYPPRPAEGEGLPDGWEIRDIPRIRGRNRKGHKQTDTYYYSPGLKFKFRIKTDIHRFLDHLEKSNGDERMAINMFHGRSTANGEDSKSASSTQMNSNKTSSKARESNAFVTVGDVGYSFRKQFEDGWYTGKVVKIRPGAAGGKDRRCHYNDGDSEDLSLAELQTLALMDPQVTKEMASSSTNSPPKSGVDLRLPQNAIGVNLPLPKDGSVYRRCELVRVLSSFPKRTRERKLAIIIARERGFAPISERNIYKLLEKAERGDHIEDTNWHALAPKPVPGFDTTWEKRFNELKEYKHKHGNTLVPVSYEQNQQLASWINHQRTYTRSYLNGVKSHITAEKFARLESIGFILDRAVKNDDHVITGNTMETEEHLERVAVPSGESEMDMEDSEEVVRVKRKTNEVVDPSREIEKEESVAIEIGIKLRKSKRRVKAPPKVDEIYQYEHIMKEASAAKKARLQGPLAANQLLASLDYHIPFEKAAEFNFNDTSENFGDLRSEKKEDDGDNKDDDKEWLEKVAASLGAADTSTLRQKRTFRPSYRPLPTASLNELSHSLKASAKSLHPHSHAMKSDTASVCSTLTCTSDNNPAKVPSGKPPDAVLISNSPYASAEVKNEPLTLLSELREGARHGRLVFHRNDSRRKVGEVILESDSNVVEVATDGTLKEFKAAYLLVVPPNHFKAGDHVPSSYGKPLTDRLSPSRKSRPKSPNSLPIVKKSSTLSVGHLFCWFCKKCDTNNKVCDSICHSCNTPKIANSKRSILLGVAENAVAGNVKNVEEALVRIPFSDRPSIPEKLIAHLLHAKSSGTSTTELRLEPCWTNHDTYFYWMCGACTMQNSFKRTTCSACRQGKGLAHRSPLLKIAEDAAKDSQTTDDALLLVPPQERLLIPRDVIDGLVTCVFMIESRSGRRRRCSKPKKEGYDYCVDHCDPILLSMPQADAEKSNVASQPCIGADLQSHAFINSECKPSHRGFIAAISKFMPSFLSGIKRAQINKLGWAINSIEDSVICGENAAFPLGMKVRRFFTNYGFHDGRIIKLARKLFVDNDTNEERPVLVYRCKYNDGDQEDLLHHEIGSLSQIYDRCNVSPEAPPHAQIPHGSLFETRNGHTITILAHKTPPGAFNQDEGGLVIARFSDSSIDVELCLLELQKAVLRKIGGSMSESKSVEIDHASLSHEVVDSPTQLIGSPSSTSDTNETAAKLLEFKLQHNPVLEWPGRGSNQSADEPIAADDECYDICDGLTLHRKRYSSPDKDEVAKLPASTSVNNSCDARPGCNVGMWDPAACYHHLSWDPYASTVCELCGIDENDHQVVICDECHSGFHTYCMRPIMANIPKGEWLCSACSGRSNVQLSFREYSDNMSCEHEDMICYLGLPYKNRPDEFFRIQCEAVSLFSLDSQAAVKQRAIRQQVQAKNVVFDVGNIKFIRSPQKNDWRLPKPLLTKESYSSSILSMVAAMKYCGMKTHLDDLQYIENAKEEMNNPSLEVDAIAPMSKRNLEIFRAFKHNTSQGVFPPVQIFHDENFGFSVKVLACMPRHTLIAEYLGEVVTMENSGQSNSDSLMVLLDTGDPETSLIIDPTMQGNIARFLSGVNNRSLLSKRKANVRTRRFIYMGKVHVCLFTSRRVEAGEILNYDYNAGNEGKDVDQWAKSGFYDTSNFF